MARHECFDLVDQKLAERNTRLVFPVMLMGDQTMRPMIETEQVEQGRGKAKAVSMFATFCPFCGSEL